MATQRVQVPVTFAYNDAGDIIAAPAGLPITVSVAATGAPATIYANDVPDNTVIASPVTDANGQVPGWMVEGTYILSVPASGPFSGASITWNAVRGDGVENIYPGAVNSAAIASKAVTAAKIADNTITTGQISPGAGIVGGQLANNTITLSQIANNLKRPQFTNQSGNYSAAVNDLVWASAGIVVTLPSAAANTNGMVGISANASASATSPVVVSGTHIKGPGMDDVSAFLLGTPYAYAILQSDGTNWRVIAGQQDTGWSPLVSHLGASLTELETTAVRLLGDMVYMRGTVVAFGIKGTNSIWVSLPAAFRPSGDTTLPLLVTGTAAPSPPVGFFIQGSDGTIRHSGSSVAAVTQVTFNSISYPID